MIRFHQSLQQPSREESTEMSLVLSDIQYLGVICFGGNHAFIPSHSLPFLPLCFG